MKTLKKTLCLVLALVMALSLMSVASATNVEKYDDAAEVGAAYVEAVDVLLGLGIVNGVSATEIAPEGYYTRAQAAKIATYLAVGAEIAEMLPATASFEDVPATHWAAKYIAYCASKNILNGVSATEYAPEAYVTGYQFAKMLLAAAGYGANNEFVGNGWAIATAGWALDKNIALFAGDATAATNDPITRQQAMLIAFNALQTLDYVAFNKDTGLYIPADLDTTEDNNTFGDKNYSLTLDTSAAADAFGRPINTWKSGTKTVATYPAAAVLTYEGPVTAGKIRADLGYADTTKTVTLATATNSKTAGAAAEITKGSDAAVGAVGSTVEIFKTGTDAYRAVVVETFVKTLTAGEIVKAVAATATTDATPAYIIVEANGSGTADDATFKTDAYKAGDVILYTKADGVIKSVVKATAVEGKLAKYTGAAPAVATMTVGGETYKVAKNATAEVKSYTNFALDKTFYVDSKNNVYAIGAAGTVTTEIDEYAYVLGVQYNVEGAAGNLFESAEDYTYAAKAKIVTTTGEVKVVDLAVYTEGTGASTTYWTKNVAANGAAKQITVDEAYAAVNAWVAFSVENGEYTALAMAGATSYTLTANHSKTNTLNSKYLTSSTAYTYINTADEVVKTVNGYKNIEIADTAVVLMVYADQAGTTVKNIYQVKTTTDVSGSSANYAYVAAKGAAVAGGTEYTLYIGGEVKTMVSTQDMTAKKVYNLTTISAQGVITAVSEVLDVTGAGTEVTLADAGYFVAGSAYNYGTTTATLVYNVTTGNAGTVDTIEVGDKVVVKADGSNNALLVYIVG